MRKTRLYVVNQSACTNDRLENSSLMYENCIFSESKIRTQPVPSFHDDVYKCAVYSCYILFIVKAAFRYIQLPNKIYIRCLLRKKNR